MKNPNRLSICLSPAPGESFTSYVTRLAADLHVSTLTILDRTGAIDAEEARFLSSGYGIVLHPQRLSSFARVTGLSSTRVEMMLLSHYDGRCFDLGNLDLFSTPSLHRVAARQWAYFSGSHVCPHCLTETGGVWNLSWKLPWSFVCPKHECLLVAFCPGCRRRIGVNRQDRGSRPKFADLIPDPLCCMNACASGEAQVGRAAAPCLTRYDTVPTLSVAAWPEAIRVQHQLNLLMSMNPSNSEKGAPLYEFNELRSLCALLLYAAVLEDFESLHFGFCDAFQKVLTEREICLAAADQWVNLRRRGAHTHVYTGVPTSPVLMAGLTCAAISICPPDGASVEIERLHTLVERSVERCHGSKYVRRLPRLFSFSPRLQTAFDTCLPQQSSVWGGWTPPPQKSQPRMIPLEARHVPQLFWKDTFDTTFVQLLPFMKKDYAQRFCSMALIKTLEQCSWAEAARFLELPAKAGAAMASRAFRFLQPEVKAVFLYKLQEIAIGAMCPFSVTMIDYQQRRHDFSQLSAINPDTWKRLCREADCSPGKRDGKARFAAAWLWSFLTGGDYRLAPALNREPQSQQWEQYQRFRTTSLNELVGPLERYAQSLVPTL
ncbi:TniQ family protein [Deinococcus oregonensis]|uniref:TniQ family protein n=1 Tax=Deinococcus oregonensis TaxID=1805970 RepID=A0ABV6B290_9DEIO